MACLQKRLEKKPLAAGSDSKQSPPESTPAGATSISPSPLTRVGSPDSAHSNSNSSRASPLAGMV